MLKYTGHPFVDVGAATIAAFVDKKDLTSITPLDLEKVADFITEQYVIDPLKSFLTVAFPNSGFTQPAYEKTPEKRVEYARRVLGGYRDDVPQLEEKCVFTGEPAVGVHFSEKFPPGRAFRQHIPLITGEGVINFHPGGDSGLPVSGEAMLCIQAFPLGCAKCSGRLLAVHSDKNDLTYEFAREFLRFNRQALQLAREAGSKKMPEAKYSACTLLIETLLHAQQRRQEAAEDRRPCSITAYHLSNSGQSVALDIYHLPLEMTDFLSLAISPDYRDEWNAISQRAWQLPRSRQKGKRTRAEGSSEEDTGPSRNMLYEDLFKLPENARSFIQTYFMRVAWRYAKEGDPRGSYSLRTEAGLVSWKLTELFLRRVMLMEKDRIQEIRDLGDRLATYTSRENDKRFFRTFFTEQRYDFFRTALIKADTACVRSGQPPLITFEQFIKIFEEGDEMYRLDWRLARDLVLIRMIEQLYQQGWLGSNQDAIPEASAEESA